MSKLRFSFILILICLSGVYGVTILAQEVELNDNDLSTLATKHELSQADMAEYVVTAKFTDKHNGVSHTYLQQTEGGIPIQNAVLHLHQKNDRLIFSTSKFVAKDGLSFVKPSAKLTAAEAANASLSIVNIVENTVLEPVRREKKNSVFDITSFSNKNVQAPGIDCKPTYFQTEKGTYEIAWEVSFFPFESRDYWNLTVSAMDGRLLHKGSFTTHCNVQHIKNRVSNNGTIGHNCSEHTHKPLLPETAAIAPTDTTKYRVFALPLESPIDGDRTLLSNPWDLTASPHGWHDDTGDDIADYEDTRGNNVHVFLDRNGDFSRDEFINGVDKVFDFEYDGTKEPIDYKSAAATNLFYMNNMMHDITYHYGFDEAAGNFQTNNFGRGGTSGDQVAAFSQFGINAATPNLDNADFSTPSDGGNGRMRMFLWQRRDDITPFEVTAPTEIAGIYPASTASFGPSIQSNPIDGEVVIADDGVGFNSDACQDITNGSDLSGKIALIDRGDCEFGVKILNAENAGAIGVIICNNRGGSNVNMGPGAVGDQVSIPSVFISQSDCSKIRLHVGTGLEVKFFVDQVTGPTSVDASLDNGIIAHEYGHGISNRLTGGRGVSSCLGNIQVTTDIRDGEQMGEGWSDFFSLITTVKPGDEGPKKRGVGTYSSRQPLDGPGIRNYPYSTDMNINPNTYYSAYDASVPHGVGAVWCSMIWDLYWRMADEYGFDDDIFDGTGGNNMAIQLVMDGMKFQTCNPGFVDGRDAILAADEALYNGANQCLIWEVFARRGLGFGASQGSWRLVKDGKESFEVPPSCEKYAKIHKSMTPLIVKGDPIDVTLSLRNDNDSEITNLVITDAIPAGTSVDVSSLPSSARVEGDHVIIEIAAMEANTLETINYSLVTPQEPSKQRLFDNFDDFEVLTRWFPERIAPLTGNTEFILSGESYSGLSSWNIRNVSSEQEQALLSINPYQITSTQPMIRFVHKYDVEPGADGGIFEISTDGAATYTRFETDEFIRNGYNNRLSVNTFVVPNVDGFTGNSGGWVTSYLDLSAYKGEEAYFRYRFASNDLLNEDGWYIDDFEIFDAVVYNSEVCLTHDGQAAPFCGVAPEWGTIVEPEANVATENTAKQDGKWGVYPNPTNQYVTIQVPEDMADNHFEIRVNDAQGKEIILGNKQALGQFVKIDMSQKNSGVYFIQLSNNHVRKSFKVIKQ